MTGLVVRKLNGALGARIEGVRLICLGGEKVPDGMRRKLAAMCAQLGSPKVQVIATDVFLVTSGARAYKNGSVE